MSEIKTVAWFTEENLTDRSATTYDTDVAERWRRKGWPVCGLVLHSDHEAEVARLRAEVETVRGYEVAPLEAKVAELRAEVEALRKDARRWQHARKLLTVDDISERQAILEEWNNLVSEVENERADEAIDAAMGEPA